MPGLRASNKSQPCRPIFYIRPLCCFGECKVTGEKHNCVTIAGFWCPGAKISATGPISVFPNEAKWVAVALHSLLKDSTGRAQIAPEVLPPVNSNLRTLLSRPKPNAHPGQRNVPRDRLEPDLLHMPVPHLALFLACTTLPSAQDTVTNTLERDPFPRPSFVPLLSAFAHVGEHLEPAAPRRTETACFHGPQSGRPQVLTAACLSTTTVTAMMAPHHSANGLPVILHGRQRNGPSTFEWNSQMPTIRRLYMDEDRTLKEVVRIMRVEHDFIASYGIPFPTVSLPQASVPDYPVTQERRCSRRASSAGACARTSG